MDIISVIVTAIPELLGAIVTIVVTAVPDMGFLLLPPLMLGAILLLAAIKTGRIKLPSVTGFKEK